MFSKLHLNRLLNHASSDNSGKLSFLSMGYEDHPFKSNQLYYFEYTNENNISSIRRINLTFPFVFYDVVGSFNGLVCIYGRQDHEIYGPACICNPITRESVILPKCKNPTNLRWNHLFDGFGYLPSTDEYKVARMYALLGETKNSVEVEIYTLDSGTGWRNLGMFDYNLEISHGVHGASANGALYWIDMEERVVAFDLAEERFRGYLSPPSLPLHLKSVVSTLRVWDGFLLYNANHDKNYSFEYEIWRLKTENDNHESLGWSKAHTAVRSEPFAFTKSGCVLRYQNSWFYIDDPKS
ncbi:F-box protein At3g07870-like [Papaver somniferum]|uniref:F-box protein At3g07870-like n=1 Tax=Papaver somniferum TaxID=3469 RepID=UPI000E705D63|nr:F-box protein At3g07870-like [Papaver somniferum]